MCVPVKAALLHLHTVFWPKTQKSWRIQVTNVHCALHCALLAVPALTVMLLLLLNTGNRFKPHKLPSSLRWADPALQGHLPASQQQHCKQCTRMLAAAQLC
jgi:hypothetical protein